MWTVATVAAVMVISSTHLSPIDSRLTSADSIAAVNYRMMLASDTASDAEKTVLRMTEEYLSDQVNSVTESRSSNRRLGTNQLPWSGIAEPLAGVLKKEAPRLEAVRGMLHGTSSEHDWGKAELHARRIALQGNRATVTGDEYTELHYRNLPHSYFYSLRHTFEFIFTDGEWKLYEDKFEDDPAQISPTPYARHGLLATLHGAVSAISPELARPIDPQNVPELDGVPPSRAPGVVLPPTADRLLAVPPEPKPDPYDGDVAAKYAHNWVNVYNPDYPSYADDCTNFVSQALEAGGWVQTPDWHSRANVLVKALNGRGATGTGLVSRSWSEAQGLWSYGTGPAARFARYSKVAENHHPHAYNATGFFTPSVGDLVFADWDHGDGKFMQHAMIVTSLDRGNGRDWHTVQISSHTANEYDKTLSEIVASAKNNDNKNPAVLGFFYAHPAG